MFTKITQFQAITNLSKLKVISVDKCYRRHYQHG